MKTACNISPNPNLFCKSTALSLCNHVPSLNSKQTVPNSTKRHESSIKEVSLSILLGDRNGSVFGAHWNRNGNQRIPCLYGDPKRSRHEMHRMWRWLKVRTVKNRMGKTRLLSFNLSNSICLETTVQF